MFELSTDQQKVLYHLIEWYKKDKEAMQYVSLGGYAGTGKTTLIAMLRKELNKLNPHIKVGFASYTGKASRVLKTKLNEEKAIFKQDSVGTIHSLIYSPIVNEKEEIIGWNTKEKIDRDIIIIDEGSMVDEVIWRHITAYKRPIIVVGDHGQLPPIKGSFNLIKKPDLKLEEIHRQARNNPIIDVSIHARTNGIIEAGTYSPLVRKFSKEDFDAQEAMNELLTNFTNDTLILCGYNITRKRLNTYIRTALGFESTTPLSGDRVICLRNNYKKNIFNGMLGTIMNIEQANDQWYNTEIAMDGDEKVFKGLIAAQQFNNDTSMNFTDKRSQNMQGDLFDFGYALTVHKAQGSQAKRVVLFEERFKQMTEDDWKRWLYTGVTRAEEELYIF